MTEEKLISRCNILMTVATMAILSGISLVIVRPKETIHIQLASMMAKTEYEKPVVEEKIRKVPHPETELRNIWEKVTVTYQTVETEYLGRYFITAYSDEETYSRATASGIEVHYSDDPYQPTTCAIDRRYHQFGELLMIDGKIYVTEDTGSNVKGLWVDVFVETMEEVHSFDTRYESVYSVSYEEHKLNSSERRKLHERFRNYLHSGSYGSRSPYRHDN